MIGALRLDGSTACLALEGAAAAEIFRAYVRAVLAPTLRAGDVVIMDHLSPHQHAPTLAFLEQTGGEVLLLPPYVPDRNPMEKLGSKVKSCLRAAEARTREALIQASGAALARVTPRDAVNWFVSCGYSIIPFLYNKRYRWLEKGLWGVPTLAWQENEPGWR